jgi:hypothetical protein
VSLTPVANAKNLQSKSLNYLVWTPLGSRVNLQIHFCLQVHFKVSEAYYCSNYLPLVSKTLAKRMAKFAAGGVETGGKFATGVVDSGGAPNLRISPRILEKI